MRGIKTYSCDADSARLLDIVSWTRTVFGFPAGRQISLRIGDTVFATDHDLDRRLQDALPDGVGAVTVVVVD